MKNKNKKNKNEKSKMIKLEDALFFGLIIFSLVFCALVFGIGKKIEKENTTTVVQNDKFPTRLERNINKMVVGHPIKEMSPFIAKQNKDVAAYLVAIAKKESNWGKHSPKKLGKECYNYWGYRGTYNKTVSGYSCFDSPEQAVEVVGGRIEELVNKDINTPQEMIVWKCGANCAGHTSYSVRKWIQDVDFYYDKLVPVVTVN